MIYVDTSIVIAGLLGENKSPPDRLWRSRLVSSQLLEFETWTRMNTLGLAARMQQDINNIIDKIDLIELSPNTLQRIYKPFPKPVRSLDAIHLASMTYMSDIEPALALASYDARMNEAAVALGFILYDL